MINKKLSVLTPTTMNLALQLCRAINGNKELRKAGLMGHIFETRRTQTRQNELIKQGKSWIPYSPHQNGSAFDLVLVYKKFKPLRITKFFWDNSKHYRTVQELASETGLYSYGLTYKKDAFHFELPLIIQPESDCFAYAVINALRWKDEEWRLMTKQDAAICAEELQAQTKKKNSLAGVLEVAKNKGWIKDFKTISSYDITNDMCCVCQTRPRVFPKLNAVERWKKINEMVAEGKGIPGHSTAVRGRKAEGIIIFNSHKERAEYMITDYSVISKVYQLII